MTYLVAKTANTTDAEKVARRLGGYAQLTAFTASEFSTRSRMHWLVTTKAGIAVGFTALLGLLVGAVVTSQTLYAATAASQREFATLRGDGYSQMAAADERPDPVILGGALRHHGGRALHAADGRRLAIRWVRQFVYTRSSC